MPVVSALFSVPIVLWNRYYRRRFSPREARA